MDIWAWVQAKKRALRRAGHGRLATIMSRLPTLVCDMKHEQAESLVPEGLILARQLDEPWVEIFLRHWLMQSRVLDRRQGRANLEECVELLEFAHREQGRECPQSVCVVQDFANCYGIADGPGYADERLRVSTETLARINPAWPCFRCISVEHASALSDAGREQEALEFIETQIARSVAAGVEDAQEDYMLSRASHMIDAGRYAEALAQLEEYGPPKNRGASGRVEWRLSKAEALARMGRLEEAERELPAVDELDRSDELDWLTVSELLVNSGQLENTPALVRQAFALVDHCRRDGADHDGALTALMAARLSAARGCRHAGELLLEAYAEFEGRLLKPELLAEERASTRAAVAATRLPALEPYASPAALLEALPDERDASLELLGAARARWPDDEALLCRYALLLADFSMGALAESLLGRFARADPESHAARRALGLLLRDRGDHAQLARFVDEHHGPDDPYGRWLLATSHERAGRLEAAARELRRLLELDPDAEVPMARLCELECQRRRWPEALELAERLVARLEPGSSDWDRITAATALGRWDLVRDSCRRLGHELADEEGPIDANWGSCKIEFEDDATRTRWARRTGPVTARVTEICGPEAAHEHHRDLVLFDPAPVTRERDDDDRALCTYRALELLQAGERRSFTLDARAPTPDQLQALRDALAPLDITLQRRSGSAYKIDDSESGARFDGMYFYVSAPAQRALEELHAALAAATAEWPAPVVWIELVEAMGDAREEERARQRALVERYGL